MRFIRNIFARSQSTQSLAAGSKPGPVMVVGMHRSGTSFLTGSLQQAGLELGKFSAWNPHNLKGNRENLDIVAFNDSVLAARGAAWDNPPKGRVLWSEAEKVRAQELIAEYDGALRWGFKDPRTLLLLDGWWELLPDLQFVGIFRHPTAVAQSLNARGGMPQEHAFTLWQAYNQRLLDLHKQVAFPLLCFDEDEGVLHSKLDTVLQELQLDSEGQGQERFFSAELKHHARQEQALPGALEHLYRQLCARAR